MSSWVTTWRHKVRRRKLRIVDPNFTSLSCVQNCRTLRFNFPFSTLIHAIETLHQKIEDGELLKRRRASGAGANLHVTAIPAGAEPMPVILGVR